MKTIVVTAAIIERDGRILITRRQRGTHLAGMWEFPGGKCEPGESLADCMKRELLEELGIRATVGAELLTTSHDYPDRRVELHFLSCTTPDEPSPQLGQDMRWVARADLGHLEFPPADAELIRLLSPQEPGPRVQLQETVPVFLVGDIAATMQWYADVLGFTSYPFPDQPPYVFAILSKDTIQIFLQQLDGYRKPDVYDLREGGVWNVFIQMAGVQALFDRLSSRPDVTILEPLEHQDYGQTHFVVRDPNGYTLVFAERDPEPDQSAHSS